MVKRSAYEYIRWLQKHSKQRDGSDLAYFKICNAVLSAHKTELNRHSQSSKHIKLSKGIAKNTSLVQILNAQLIALKLRKQSCY